MPNSCWIDGSSGEKPRFDSWSANIATSVTTKGNIHLDGDEGMEFVVMTE
jgi:hypothetical protein